AQYWEVVVAALVTGTINALDVPCRQAFQVELVGKQDLLNAIALNSSVFNASAVIGPSIAGVLIAVVGVPICFLLNSVSYLAAIAALLLMRDLPTVEHHHEEEPLRARLARGAAYARGEPVVGLLLVVVAVFSLFAMNRTTLLPLFADQVLHVGAHGCGFLLASMGLGSLIGALTLAFFPRLGADPRRQLWMAGIWIAALLEFSLSRVFAVSLVTLFVAGYCQISFIAAANSRIQTLTPDRLRGRVMALYAEALTGAGPFRMANPPAMIAAGISTNPLGTMPLSANVQDVSAAAKPRMNPGANVSRNPLSPAVRMARAATRTNASTLWLKMSRASSIAPL